jgi:hypothetical protein
MPAVDDAAGEMTPLHWMTMTSSPMSDTVALAQPAVATPSALVFSLFCAVARAARAFAHANIYIFVANQRPPRVVV